MLNISIETERLLIRPVTAQDEQGFFEMDADADVHRFLGNKPVKTIEEIRAVIEYIWQQYKDNGVGRLAVIEKSTGDFIGWTGLKLITTEINGRSNYYDLGYRFIKRYWGKGYATESAKASLMYGFDKMNLTTIYAMADVRNEASKKILEKTGLQCMETFYYNHEEHYWFEITKEQWLKDQIK